MGPLGPNNHQGPWEHFLSIAQKLLLSREKLMVLFNFNNFFSKDELANGLCNQYIVIKTDIEFDSEKLIQVKGEKLLYH